MSRRVIVAIPVVFGVVVLASSFASAADPVVVNVPFGFTVRDTALPAGHYEIRAIGNLDEQIQVRSLDAEKEAVTMVITRIADARLKEPEVIFDKVDGAYVLSEVREPGIDGFLVHATKGPHSKERVRGEVKSAHNVKRSS